MVDAMSQSFKAGWRYFLYPEIYKLNHRGGVPYFGAMKLRGLKCVQVILTMHIWYVKDPIYFANFKIIIKSTRKLHADYGRFLVLTKITQTDGTPVTFLTLLWLKKITVKLISEKSLHSTYCKKNKTKVPIFYTNISAGILEMLFLKKRPIKLQLWKNPRRYNFGMLLWKNYQFLQVSFIGLMVLIHQYGSPRGPQREHTFPRCRNIYEL